MFTIAKNVATEMWQDGSGKLMALVAIILVCLAHSQHTTSAIILGGFWVITTAILAWNTRKEMKQDGAKFGDPDYFLRGKAYMPYGVYAEYVYCNADFPAIAEAYAAKYGEPLSSFEQLLVMAEYLDQNPSSADFLANAKIAVTLRNIPKAAKHHPRGRQAGAEWLANDALIKRIIQLHRYEERVWSAELRTIRRTMAELDPERYLTIQDLQFLPGVYRTTLQWLEGKLMDIANGDGEVLVKDAMATFLTQVKDGLTVIDTGYERVTRQVAEAVGETAKINW